MLSSLAATVVYTTTTTSSGSGIGIVPMLIYLVLVAVVLVGMWRMFEKAGEKGWKALIPLYNTWVLLEIAGKPGWWIVLLLIPFVNFVVLIIVSLELAKRFGKSAMFAIFGLLLFPYVGYSMLGLGDAKYDGGKYKPAAVK
jgi:hypothetical protein